MGLYNGKAVARCPNAGLFLGWPYHECAALQATLQGAGLLFCSPKCEGEYIMAAGGSALRRLLRDLERGVCQICKLDCLNVVKRLR